MASISAITRRIRAFGILGALAFTLAGTAVGATPAIAASSTTDGNVQAVCAPATPGTAQCQALRRTDVPLTRSPMSARARAASPQATIGSLSAYAPADLRAAYSLPTGPEGSGLTVAIVDAYDLPTAEADLAAYRSFWGLPACTTANGCFSKVDQGGGTAYPVPNQAWGTEIALDMDMVSAACPNCNILLVEATSNSYADLGRAVNTAVSLGAVAVSNSYAGPEWPSEAIYDSFYDHPGVAITASTGDCGYNCAGLLKNVGYPAASPDVVAVGGTTLTVGGGSRGWTELAWGHGAGGTGSGCSQYEPKPAWQTDTQCSMRTEADVSAVADPQTGVWVYDTYGTNGWSIAGGTSASSPIVAAAFALAGGPANGTYPGKYLYDNASHLWDAIGGNNAIDTGLSGPCTVTYLCNGVAGYDGPTGLGTPNGILAFKAPTSGTYHPLTPTRILDTRSGVGLSGVFSSHVARQFQVTGGSSGVPANATAVTGNLTVTQQTSSGFLSVGPNSSNSPTSSTLNFPVGDDRANAVTVALGTGGALWATYAAPTLGPTAQVLFDVTGYFTPDTTGATYHPLTPERLLDSRDGTGGTTIFSSHLAQDFQVTGGSSGIPSNAVAVTGNLTVTQQTSLGFVYVGPSRVNNPTSSNLNFPLGDDRANAVTVALGSGGLLWVTYAAPSTGPTAQVIFDVTGYFTPDMTGATYRAVAPRRVLDSRNGSGGTTFLSHQAQAFVGSGGTTGVSYTAVAVTGNLTVTQQASRGFLYIGPDMTNNPTSSNLNFPVGDDRANAVAVALGSGGSLFVTYAAPDAPGQTSTAQVLFDVTGYFIPS